MRGEHSWPDCKWVLDSRHTEGRRIVSGQAQEGWKQCRHDFHERWLRP